MLNVSIVLYKNTIDEISLLVQTLRKSEFVAEIYLVDNSPVYTPALEALPVKYIFNCKNTGYGKAHNVAMRQTIEQNIPYHLVLNPDISLEPGILKILLEFMNNNSEIGQLMPKVYYPNHEIQYLCKLIPTPFDLIFRRFLPESWTRKRTDKFEMRATGYNRIMDVPYLSGCFMLLRTSALKEVGLFDERFFMYPEDIDLTRRMHQRYRTVFYPAVSIVHHHARKSYADIKMLWVHTTNMIKYFNKWGWFFDTERRKTNALILKQLFVNN